MKVRNVREFALEIGAIGQLVNPGESVEVADELGAALCEQPANWQPVKSTKTKSEED